MTPPEQAHAALAERMAAARESARHLHGNDSRLYAAVTGLAGLLDAHRPTSQPTVGGSTLACTGCGAGEAAYRAYAPDAWPVCPVIAVVCSVLEAR